MVRDNGDGYARIVELEVCGQRRIYQDLGGARGYAWMDVTTTTGGEEPRAVTRETARAEEAPASPTATAATSSASATGAFGQMVRGRISERARAILLCVGEPVAVRAQWTSAGVVSFSARGIADPAIGDCIGAAVGSISVPAGTLPGELLHPVAP